MNLKHLIQGYNFNKIPARIQEEINTPEEQAGVINYNENTNASYLLDEEGMIKTICLFSNCIATNCKSIKEQLEHVTQTLIIIQKTIEILGNTKKEEANSILKQLGLFNNKKIKTKAVRFTNYIYKIDIADGLLIFSMIDETNNQKKRKNFKKKSPHQI